MNLQRVSIIAGIAIAGATIIGGAIALDRKYDESAEVSAIASDLELTKQRLDVKILQDRISGAQSRIWSLEDRYRGRSMPQATTEEIRRLKTQINEWRRQLNKRS